MLVITRICFPYFPMESRQFLNRKNSIEYFFIPYPYENFSIKKALQVEKNKSMMVWESPQNKYYWNQMKEYLPMDINSDYPEIEKIEKANPGAKMIVTSPSESFTGRHSYAGIYLPEKRNLLPLFDFYYLSGK